MREKRRRIFSCFLLFKFLIWEKKQGSNWKIWRKFFLFFVPFFSIFSFFWSFFFSVLGGGMRGNGERWEDKGDCLLEDKRKMQEQNQGRKSLIYQGFSALKASFWYRFDTKQNNKQRQECNNFLPLFFISICRFSGTHVFYVHTFLSKICYNKNTQKTFKKHEPFWKK